MRDIGHGRVNLRAAPKIVRNSEPGLPIKSSGSADEPLWGEEEEESPAGLLPSEWRAAEAVSRARILLSRSWIFSRRSCVLVFARPAAYWQSGNELNQERGVGGDW